MTLQVGDGVVVIPLRDGGRVTIRSGAISVGDKAVLIPGANGQIYAVRPASPQVGDKVIVYPLRNGGHVCLASADADGGGSSPSVMPPGNFDARRTGLSTASLKWLPGEGNTAVRIVRRPDRYPVHINDGTVAYEGAGKTATDTGLDLRSGYYYCAWGKAGSRYSNGYLMDQIGTMGIAFSPISVCGSWHRQTTEPGEVVTYGPYYRTWDGRGKVYVSSSSSTAGSLKIDNRLVVSGPVGSKEFGSGEDGWWTSDTHIAEITSLLVPGGNFIVVSIRDTGTEPGPQNMIGTDTPLYIMRSL